MIKKSRRRPTEKQFIFSSALLSYSQFDYYKGSPEYKHKGGQIILSASPDVLINTPNGIQFAGGMKIQLFLGKRISVDADLVVGLDYVHFSSGLIGVPLGHISYHIPVNENFEASPYISILRFKHASEHKFVDVYDNYPDPDFISDQLCFATGIQFNRYFGKFVLSPYGEYTRGYNDHVQGLSFGIYCGVYFNTPFLNRPS